MATMPSRYSSLHNYIEHALSLHAASFEALEKDMSEFKPRPIEPFAEDRDRLRKHLMVLNPQLSAEQIQNFVDAQIDMSASERVQFVKKFLRLPYELHAHVCEQISNGSLRAVIEMILRNQAMPTISPPAMAG
jgi:hypothetical protein